MSPAKKTVSLFVLLSALLLIYFLFRNSLLNLIIEHRISGVKQKYELEVHAGKIQFFGFKSIRFSDLQIISETNDTILNAENIEINPAILRSIFGRLKLHALLIKRLDVKMNSNLLEIWLNRHKGDTLQDATQNKAVNYSTILNKIGNELFVAFPKEIDISNASFRYQRQKLFSLINCKHFVYRNKVFEGSFDMKDNFSKQAFAVTGSLDKNKHIINFLLSQIGHDQVKLPYIGPRWQAGLAFDSLYLHTSFEKMTNNQVEITAEASARNLLITHRKVSPEPVLIKNGRFVFHIIASNNLLELDSSSIFNLNGFSFSPYISYTNSPEKILTIEILKKEFAAQSLIDAFPKGLFLNLRGMQLSGKLIYSLHSSLDFTIPDSSKFNSRLEGKSLVINHFGQTNFSKLNESFLYEVYDDDQKVASFIVGPENPDFVKLDEISPFLRYSVLTGEDGGFFYHKGFSEDAFRESIIENLKEHRFARGGSTLTMQLVKNVFLSHEKTISRKVEEALIVWLIENLHLVSKERMFEVYLNIIEWGPGIYGIKNASAFYFKKLPRDLTLAESIYLSAIIPRPKGFRYIFEQNGELKSFMNDYFKQVSDIMLRRSQITETDTFGLSTHVMLTGPAKMMLQLPDTMSIDSSIIIPLKNELPAFAEPADN